MRDEANASPKVCVIGGGATGLSFLWALKSQETTRSVDVTLLHDQVDMTRYRGGVTIPELGGHSVTVQVDVGGNPVPVDLGVQFVCPLIYPNLDLMLGRPEFKDRVVLDEVPALDVGVTIDEQINWGNFPAYQSGPLFGFYSRVEEEMTRFELLGVDFSELRLFQTLKEYFAEEAAKGRPYSSDFIDYALFPYLSILNGYGGSELLAETTFIELLPLFMPLEDPGPLASFRRPGRGWQRFRGGSSTWIEAMASFARGQGHTTIRTGARVLAVFPSKTGSTLTVVWQQADGRKMATFDHVVFTTDMDTNGAILNNPDNGYWSTQQKVIGQFDLKPGSCYIHADDGVFPRYLTERGSTTCFCASYARREPGKSPPYDLAHSYSTFNIQNMVPGAPPGLYLTMYGNDRPQHPPDPAKTYASATWKHGAFLGPQLREAARQVHQIQGLGNMWFAGNNTSMDSEEGALVSAMVIAEKIFPGWRHPFATHVHAELIWLVIRDLFMFPVSSARALLRRAAEDLVRAARGARD